MKAVLAATGVAVALAAAGPVDGADMPMPDDASTPHAHVSIGFADYSPARVDVLEGDTIEWTNDSVRRHTVTDDAGRYDSDVIASGDHFTHRFDEPGAYAYHCRLHPGIRGEVDAWTLLLERPAAPAAPGRPYPLRGRAALPAGTPVEIEAGDGSGAGYRRVASATVGADGSFTAEIRPQGTATYRATAGDDHSPAVDLLVLDHTIAATVRRGRRATVVSVRVTPADPGATVVLQLSLRERFGWWPVARKRLDRGSRARFVLHLRRAVSARALLTLRDGATQLASTPPLRVGPSRRAR